MVEWNKELKDLGYGVGQGSPFGVASMKTEALKDYKTFYIHLTCLNGQWNIYRTDKQTNNIYIVGFDLQYFKMLDIVRKIDNEYNNSSSI